MSADKIPTLQFDTRKAQDIAFEIFRIEDHLKADHVPPLFRQTFYIITVLTAGAGTNQIDFNAYPIMRGGVYFITSGQVQRWESTEPLSGYALLFDESFLPINSVDSITPRNFDYFHRTDIAPVLYLDEAISGLTRLCDDMLIAYHDKDIGRTELLQSYLRIFLICLQRRFARQRTELSTSVGGVLVENYIRLVDIHFQEKHRVSDYASMLGVTAGHLTDTTNSQLGIPASHLIKRRLVLEAKRLLTYSEKHISEIAFTLHFDDPSYFARYFHREVGQSPTAFRKSIREKYPSPHLKS